jgi:hypothetical protein
MRATRLHRDPSCVFPVFDTLTIADRQAPDSASKNALSACLAERIADRWPPLADIVPGDLDIAALGQLSPARLTFRDWPEAASLQMKRPW